MDKETAKDSGLIKDNMNARKWGGGGVEVEVEDRGREE